MRILAGEAPDCGTVGYGQGVIAAYFAQDQGRSLDPTQSVWAEAYDQCPLHAVPNLRALLGGFLFSGDDIHKPVGVLSGGERNRLALVKLLLRPANLLLLDEPTNHLDIASKDVLLEALAHFAGTLVFVSHDRYFIEKLATKIIEVANGEVAVYPGSYEAFLWSKAASMKAPSIALPRTPTSAAAPPTTPPGAKSERVAEREARKASERNARRRKRRIAEIEAAITAAESRQAQVEVELTEPTLYQNGDRAEALANEHERLKQQIDTLLLDWEQAHEETP